MTTLTPTQSTAGAAAPAASTPPALDPTLVNLAKAIRQTETRGAKDPYTAKGGSGEFGAYQYTPGTWSSDVKAFTGKDVPLAQADKLLQNEVAYKKLESLKKQGYNVGQIASIWNSGSPEWEGKTGTNKYGVKYDVPQYVDSVSKAYQALKAGEAPDYKKTASTVGPEANMTDVQKADSASQQKTGAFFPYMTGDSPLTAGLKAAGNLPGSAFNFAKGALNMVLHPIDTAKNVLQHPIDSLVPEGIQGAAEALYGLAKHPINAFTGGSAPELDEGLARASRAFVNDPFGNAAPVVLGVKGGAKVVDSVTGKIAQSKVADYVANPERAAAGEPIPRSTGTNFGGAVDSAISTAAKPVMSAFGKVGDVVRGGPKLTPEDYAGEILQGDTAMRSTGAKVLGNLDTKGPRAVNTYDDLVQRLGSAIEENQTKVDTEYAKDTTPRKLAELTQRSKGVAPINYVSEALKGLQEFYTKARDVNGIAWAKNITSKAKTAGLTPAEINTIAKKYGGEFGQKAFSKVTNEPLTSVNAQAYENIRTGLKTTARGFLKDDAAKNLDKDTSNMIRVKAAAEKVQEKVNALDQRIQQRGLLTKVGRAIGGAVDIVSGGLLRGFFQKILLDSNRGNKSYNSLQIEENLNANLKKLQYLERVNDSTLVRIMKETMQALPAPVQSTIKAGAKSTVFGRTAQQVEQSAQ